MATNNIVTHAEPNNFSFGVRIRAQGFTYTAAAENVAAGQASVAAVMTSWMNSPGHRTNILNKTYKFFGAGQQYTGTSGYHRFWSQEFAASSTEACSSY